MAPRRHRRQAASRSGKTTALRVAGSVWGGGGINGYLRQWRATANGLEGTAEAHSDALLCLDEMGQVDGREAGGIAYMLAKALALRRMLLTSSEGKNQRPVKVPSERTLKLYVFAPGILAEPGEEGDARQ